MHLNNTSNGFIHESTLDIDNNYFYLFANYYLPVSLIYYKYHLPVINWFARAAMINSTD